MTCVAIGLLGATTATRAIVAMLFSVSRLDPITYAGVIAILATAPRGAAAADTAETCAAAAEQAQDLRRTGELRAARDRLVAWDRVASPIGA